MRPNDLLSAHFRLDRDQRAALLRLGLSTIRDLLYHFPARYEREGASNTVAHLVPGTKVSLIGVLRNLEAKKLWKSRRAVTEGTLEDATGRVRVLWFNQPYIKSYVKENVVVKVSGAVGPASVTQRAVSVGTAALLIAA